MNHAMVITRACNRINFEAACSILKFYNPTKVYSIEKTYEDYGAGYMWETIICGDEAGREYQLLSPKEWNILNITEDLDDIIKVAKDHSKGGKL